MKSAAETMRPNPAFAIEQAITELGVGEALVSLLDEKGRPGITERALIVPPGSQLGPLPDAERARSIAASPLAGFYEKSIDRESAYERLKGRAEAPPTEGARGSATLRPRGESPRRNRSSATTAAASHRTSCSGAAVRVVAAKRKGSSRRWRRAPRAPSARRPAAR